MANNLPLRNSFVSINSNSSQLQRVFTKLLASSLLRNLPSAELKFFANFVSGLAPLFKVERADLEEIRYNRTTEFIASPEGASRGCFDPPWSIIKYKGGWSKYGWVFFYKTGSLALRGVDHLLAGEADILWAPLPGVPLKDARCGAYLKKLERNEQFRPAYPWSRPGQEAASSAVWAVRGEHFETVMRDWERIASVDPEMAENLPAEWRIESAWNRLLLDTPLRVARFEKDEIQFPCLPAADFLKWKDAAILHVGDWPEEDQLRFLQAWYFGTYYGDSSGLFLDILEP